MYGKGVKTKLVYISVNHFDSTVNHNVTRGIHRIPQKCQSAVCLKYDCTTFDALTFTHGCQQRRIRTCNMVRPIISIPVGISNLQSLDPYLKTEFHNYEKS